MPASAIGEVRRMDTLRQKVSGHGISEVAGKDPNNNAPRSFVCTIVTAIVDLSPMHKSCLTPSGHSVDAIIEAKGLKQMSDTGELEKIIDAVLATNAQSVEEFKAGKEKAFNALVGQVMKASRGKANPGQVNDRLKARLAR